jgi:acyl-homoserine lactone acylase PvdQ
MRRWRNRHLLFWLAGQYSRAALHPRFPPVALVAALAVVAAFAPAAHAADYADFARNVLAPGQAGGLPKTPNSTDQIPLYDGLTPLFDRVTAADLNKFYKPNVFGTKGQGKLRTERTPNKRVKIVRDKWGVPHITAKARKDVMYGAGFVAAQDRQLLLELARGPGRIALLDAPGINAFGLVTSVRQFVPSAQADAIIGRQADLLRKAGKSGRQTLADIDAYVDGINGFYTQSGQIKSGAVKRWTRVDMLAISGFIGSIFGRGGGGEDSNARFLAELQAKLGEPGGRAVFDDLRQAVDPDSPASVEKAAPYNATPANHSGNAPLDAGSFTPAAAPKSAPRPADRKLMSNTLLVSAKRSATKHPLFVGGPQLGYYYPEIVGEMDLHGGGIDARGIASAGAGPYVFIGRGQDFAWSLTSASNDIVDIYVESLCGNSDTRYTFDGKCKQMTVTNAGTLKGAGGQPDEAVRFHETVHGPVIGYATSGGQKVALSWKRSTRGREVLSLLAFNDLNSNRVDSASSFFKSINKLEHTFNALYADDRDIAMFSTGRLPIRPKNVDPSLPPLGTGGNEWTGFLSAKGHPQQINPKSGYILNWNNRPAPGFAAADDNWDYGSVHRVEMFDPIKKFSRARLNNVVSVMNAAATQDLRSTQLTPVVAEVLGTSAAPSPRAQRMLEIVKDWTAQGSSRLDVDLDGKIDHPGAAIWDAWYPKLADAVLSPVLGDLTASFASFHARGGLSFGGGWFSYIDKDLRTLLGQPVKAKYANRYCGKGDLAACQASIWAALDAAGADLEAAQGSDPGAWRRDANAERIKFVPGLIPDTMRWTNRPTFQQVNSFDGHRPR